ncbi:MAG TPA: 3-phosphoshikimate 1-carboxyvinyltransferase [Bacteroidales bacterium]|nr:3-phosphoshikimate 1-carboxyvinyltransferase [Bacteroidales bacterium]
MNVTVYPSGVRGCISAPPSKSLTQRAIAAGVLADGQTVILNPSFCEDSMAAIGIARALGSSVEVADDRIVLDSSGQIQGDMTLNCGESGLALRMFSPVAALFPGVITLTGHGSLLQRPVSMISEALSQLGIKADTNGGLLPVRLSGRLRAGRVLIDGSAGSQLLTGLLMALPVAEADSRLDVANLTSKPYIGLTLGLLHDFGITVENEDYRIFRIPGNQSYRAHEYTVEGDWSGAAFLLVAGATAGRVTVTNLNADSLQADRAILSALKEAGALPVVEPGGITAAISGLRAFTFDATDSPDLFPPLAALAASCEGKSSIRGVSRLRHKESDRAEAIAEVLGAMKISVRLRGDEMIITGGRVQGAVVSSHNDHRIAMMAAVMAAGAAGKVTITGAESVAKSYPGFFKDLSSLGAQSS